jgi:hypothetical protein
MTIIGGLRLRTEDGLEQVLDRHFSKGLQKLPGRT